MRFRKAITIPVFIFTDEEFEAQKLGIGNDDQGFEETEDRLFWLIDSAHPDKNDDQRTVFYAGGESYIAPCSIGVFGELINNHIKHSE